MSLDFQAAREEYIGWLATEANRSPNTVRGYDSEIRRLGGFLAARGHSLRMDDLTPDDLRAFQRHLAATLRAASSRSRALVAVRSWLRWLAREELVPKDLSNRITLPKLEQRLPKPMDPEELSALLAALPRESPIDRRDRALVQFLVSTGCRISEALSLNRQDVPRHGNRLVVTGKGSKQRPVYLTEDAREAVDDYLLGREDTSPALFVNYDRSELRDPERRLTPVGARSIVRKLRVRHGAWSLRSPHVFRHTTATTLLEVTGGDVRLVQDVLGHANLNTLQGYTRIVDSRKQDAYRAYQRHLEAGRGTPAGEPPPPS